MTLNITPNYDAKILHVGVRAPTKKVRKNDENGLVYNPRTVYSKINTTSERMYEDFFKRDSEVIVLPIITEQGPGELATMLAKDFGVEHCMIVGGITASFRAASYQAQRIIQDLKENPQKYFVSEEKKEFNGQRFVVG